MSGGCKVVSLSLGAWCRLLVEGCWWCAVQVLAPWQGPVLLLGHLDDCGCHPPAVNGNLPRERCTHMQQLLLVPPLTGPQGASAARSHRRQPLLVTTI